MSYRLQLLLGLFLVSLFVGIPTAAALQDETPEPAETQETTAEESDTPAVEEKEAEKAETPSDEESETPKDEPEEAAADVGAADFDAIFDQWKGMIAELRALQDEYKIAQPEDRAALVEKFNGLVAQGDEMAPRLRKAAEAAFTADPQANLEVGNFLASTVLGDMANGENAEALRVARLLIEHDFPNKAIFNEAGVAAFNAGDGQVAIEFFQQAEEAGVLNPRGEMHKKEQLLRNAEAEADDLPRVVLTTNKGEITIELFENEAPNTVANFIELVEKGFYNGLSFHRVIEGFMAQGGCPKGDGTGGPGYNIACESYEENHREHFTGSLSMAHAGRDTGGSQFFITFAPTSHLDGKHTVFGRVIDGMDVVNSLQVRSPQGAGEPEADTIIEAKVLRKRDHDYKAKHVGS